VRLFRNVLIFSLKPNLHDLRLGLTFLKRKFIMKLEGGEHTIGRALDTIKPTTKFLVLLPSKFYCAWRTFATRSEHDAAGSDLISLRPPPIDYTSLLEKGSNNLLAPNLLDSNDYTSVTIEFYQYVHKKYNSDSPISRPITRKLVNKGASWL
jgi:hypothetical protein